MRRDLLELIAENIPQTREADDPEASTEEIENQIDNAIEQAAVILFVVDGREGITPLDDEVARKLRYETKPIVLVANKCDTEKIDPQTAEFYKLGRGKLICVSAQQNRNREALLNLIVDLVYGWLDPRIGHD